MRCLIIWLYVAIGIGVVGNNSAQAANAYTAVSGYAAAPYQHNAFPPYLEYSTIREAADAAFQSAVSYYNLVGCTYDLLPGPDGNHDDILYVGIVKFLGNTSCTRHNQGLGVVVIGAYYLFDPYKNMGCADSCQAGDPINLGTGNEYEDQEDYSVSSVLGFHRYYNSSYAVAATHIGTNWRDSFDRRVEFLTDGGANSTARVYRSDGKQVLFHLLNGTWIADPDVNDVLIEDDDSQGNITGWRYFCAATQQIESYNAHGLLASISSLNGQVTTLTYSDASTPPSVAPAAGLLVAVTGPRGRKLQFVYNADSRIAHITLPGGEVLAYTYDTFGNLIQVTYPGGHARTYKYDESGNAPSGFPSLLTGIIDESGTRYADIHYDTAHRTVSSQLGGIANLIHVAYDVYSAKASVIWPLGVQSTLGVAAPYGRMRVSSNSQPCGPSCNQTAASRTYDTNGNPASSTDFNGVATTYTYDANGLETQRIEAQGTQVQRTTNTTWDTVWRNPLERTRLDANGNLTAKTDWVYNARGQGVARCEDDPAVSGATGYTCSTSGTPPAGVRRWLYTYCDSVSGQCPLVGLLLSVDGPRTDVADITRYVYYQTTDESRCGKQSGACHRAGDLYRVTDARNRKTTYVAYDAAGRLTHTLDVNGVNTYMTYTPRGWLHTRNVAGAKTTIAYDAVGNVVKVTQPDGVFTTYAYDTAHRLISIGDAMGNHIDFTLDEAGNRIAENTYAAGSGTPSRSLSRVYNTLGELVQSLDAYGHASTYAYDANGNRTDTTDPLGVTTHASYDALSRLSQTVQNYLGSDPSTANTTTSYAYDSQGNVNQVTDPDGLVTHYYHNGLNELDQRRSPDTGTTNYTYDAAGNRISKTDARGVISIYTYDALDRLTGISYPTPGLNVSYYYGQGNATTGCARSRPIGRRTQMVDSSGNTFWCYDARGNVIEKIQAVGAAQYTTFYTYNAANRLMGMTYPDGASVAYTRDADGRIISVAATPVGGLSTTIASAITYLPFGPATGYSFAGGGQVLNKAYDANYRATDIEGSALNLHFTLDAMGDITAEGNAAGVPAPNESYVYDPLYRLQQVDDATGTPWQSYTYDKTGDRLSKATAGLLPADTYTYQSGTHRLLGISGYDVSNRAMDANGNTTAFQANGWTYGLGYNDTNRLTAVQQNGTNAATYSINGKGERTLKILSGGASTAYVYDQVGKLLGEYTAATHRDYVWAGSTLVAILDSPAQGGDAIHYVYTDGLGTPRAVTTQSGTLTWDWPYTRNPFGEAPASGNGYTLNLRYPGQYFDQEDGLHYNYYRDYEPGTGRYAQPDPLGLGGGINTYAYVSNDPINNFDPLGLCACLGGHWRVEPLGFGVSAAFGGLVSVSKSRIHCVADPSVSVHAEQFSIAGGAIATLGAGWNVTGDIWNVSDSNDLSGWSTNQCFVSVSIFGASFPCGPPGGGTLAAGPGVGGGIAWGSTYTWILSDTCKKKKDCGSH